MPRIEGWGYPLNTRKAHYFVDGISLCKRWMYLGTDLEQDNNYTPDKCKDCIRILEEIRRSKE